MDENRLLLSRLDDLIYKSYAGESASIGFLNEVEASAAHNYLKNLGVEHCFFGGYSSALRVLLYLPDFVEDRSGIVSLKIIPKAKERLTHRDYLGSLMGLGIKRECVGDILVGTDFTLAFVKSEISGYILNSLTSVGNVSVEVSVYSGCLDSLVPEAVSVEILLTSMRIDNFVASVCNCSRQSANEYINSDCVFVNYSCNIKPSKAIAQGDTISIRGFGKFKIEEIVRYTKSKRPILSVLQYK